ETFVRQRFGAGVPKAAADVDGDSRPHVLEAEAGAEVGVAHRCSAAAAADGESGTGDRAGEPLAWQRLAGDEPRRDRPRAAQRARPTDADEGSREVVARAPVEHAARSRIGAARQLVVEAETLDVEPCEVGAGEDRLPPAAAARALPDGIR